MKWSYADTNRTGDHIWWVSEIQKFQALYPACRCTYDIAAIMKEIHDGLVDRVRTR